MNLFRDVVDLIFPVTCGACDDALADSEAQLCTSCSLHLPYSKYFGVTQSPLKQKFLGRIPLFVAANLFEYNGYGPLKNLLINIKYKHRPELAYTVGTWMGEKLHHIPLHPPMEVLLPVPLHPKKLKTRGYNQAAEIAKGIGAVLHLPVDTLSLIRTRANITQTKLDKLLRWQNSENLFALTNHASALAGKHVALVDDVVTTGATLEQVYHAIAPIGPKTISLLVLAQTQ